MAAQSAHQAQYQLVWSLEAHQKEAKSGTIDQVCHFPSRWHHIRVRGRQWCYLWWTHFWLVVLTVSGVVWQGLQWRRCSWASGGCWNQREKSWELDASRSQSTRDRACTLVTSWWAILVVCALFYVTTITSSSSWSLSCRAIVSWCRSGMHYLVCASSCAATERVRSTC